MWSGEGGTVAGLVGFSRWFFAFSRSGLYRRLGEGLRLLRFVGGVFALRKSLWPVGFPGGRPRLFGAGVEGESPKKEGWEEIDMLVRGVASPGVRICEDVGDNGGEVIGELISE